MASTAKVQKAFQGVFCNEEATPGTSLQDLLSDGVWDIQHPAADGAAATDGTYWAIKAPFDLLIVDAVACPGGALTSSDTVPAIITLAKADGAGGSATAIAALTTNTASGDWTADVYKAFTITAANAAVTKGQLITLKKTHTSTGTVVPICSFSIRYRRS